MTPGEAVETLHRFGAPAVLAHPSYIKNLQPVLTELKAAGLVGMEVYYRDYDAELVEKLARVAKENGLLPLGGSDYHALDNPGEREPGDIPLPSEIAKQFLEAELTWVSTRQLS